MEKKIYDLKNYLVKDENGNIKCTIQPKDYHLIMSLENLPGEEWRRIKGCSLYSVSNMGRVRAESYEKWYSDSRRFQFYPTHIMAQGKNGNYLIVSLVNDMGNTKSYRVNRLVLEAFTDNPQNLPDACHRNENSFDNRLVNLYWGTRKENLNSSLHRARISKKRGTPIKCDSHEFSSITKTAKFYNVAPSEMWKWLTGKKPMPKEWKDRGLQLLEE